VAFLKTEGGTIVIGVEDNGTVVGIDDDVNHADHGKPNRDGYMLFLRNALADTLGADVATLCDMSLHIVQGKAVCRIWIEPSPRPAYANGHLIVRNGNQKRKLAAQEALAYVKQWWGGR